jgi:hypothetical protein
MALHFYCCKRYGLETCVYCAPPIFLDRLATADGIAVRGEKLPGRSIERSYANRIAPTQGLHPLLVARFNGGAQISMAG